MKMYKLIFQIMLILFLAGCTKSISDNELPIQVDSRKDVIQSNRVGYSLYPNPFSSHLNITISGTQNFEILVSDETGRTKQIDSSVGDNLILDFSSCETGVYYCEIVLEGKVYSERLFHYNAR